MWHCVISGGVIARQSARNCFKYYNLWYAVRFAWCHWGKISKFNIFHFLPASAVSVSDNFSSPHGDSRWGRGKWLEVTVPWWQWSWVSGANCGSHHPFVIGWSKYRLGLALVAMHCGLACPLGIPTVFQRRLTVSLHSPNGRQIACR